MNKPSQAPRRPLLWLWTAALLVCLMASPALAQAEVIDRIVAKINRDIITLNDLKRASGPYMLAFGIDPQTLPQRPDADEIYRQVLDDMINTQLLVQEAQTLKLKVNDGDVARWIDNTVTQQNITEEQFKTALRSKGIRWRDYRTYIRDNLLKFRVIQVRIGSKVKVSQSELEDAYKDSYGEDAGEGVKVVDVSHIFIPLAADADVETRKRAETLVTNTHKRVLAAEEDFATIAREVSAGPTASDGGYLGTYRNGDLAGPIEKVVFSAEQGDTTEPIKVDSGYHIFRVHEIRSERDPRVEERMESLRGKLREKELNRELNQWLETLRQKSYVKVMY
jgi:peptidyl-prolyl cis-trans isomerase SurA